MAGNIHDVVSSKIGLDTEVSGRQVRPRCIPASGEKPGEARCGEKASGL